MNTSQGKSPLIIIAVGGNSLIRNNEHASVPDQYEAVCETMSHIADLISEGCRVVLTHGNGPQVGFILLRSDLCLNVLHPVPLDSCVADTQGALGYQFQMSLSNEFRRRNMDRQVVSIVTQVLVDADDPSFQKPSKPIGKFLSESEALERKNKFNWTVMEDAGRGWRRVVASPNPVSVIETPDFTVIAVGGGGIPVILNKETNQLDGAAAVIDKDLASSLLATSISADMIIISTAVPYIYLNFGKSNQKALEKATLSELKQYVEEGHFKPGSMLPKIHAIIRFLENGGKHAVVTTPENLLLAYKGEVGTHCFP